MPSVKIFNDIYDIYGTENFEEQYFYLDVLHLTSKNQLKEDGTKGILAEALTYLFLETLTWLLGSVSC